MTEREEYLKNLAFKYHFGELNEDSLIIPREIWQKRETRYEILKLMVLMIYLISPFIVIVAVLMTGYIKSWEAFVSAALYSVLYGIEVVRSIRNLRRLWMKGEYKFWVVLRFTRRRISKQIGRVWWNGAKIEDHVPVMRRFKNFIMGRSNTASGDESVE